MRSASGIDNAKRRHALRWRRSVARAVVVLLAVGDAAIAAELMRLRVTLDSPLPNPLRGELFVSDGSLEKLQPLSLNPTAAAGLSLVDGRVLVHPKVANRRDAFDVTVRWEPGATLGVRLDGPGGAVATLDLDAARAATPSAPVTAPLADSGVVVSLSRMAADRLRVETGRNSLVFTPEEKFTFDVFAEPLGLEEGEAFELRAFVSAGRDGEEVWRSPVQRLAADAAGQAHATFEAPLPKDDGVYSVRLSATRPAGWRSKLLPSSPLLQSAEAPIAERTFQVAVVDPSKRPPKPGDWQETYTYDPRRHRWADRVPERLRWKRLPWLAGGPKRSETGADTVRDGAVEIGPAMADGAVHWRAYPLPIDDPGRLYAVEVELLGAPGEPITLAVLEPDALGDLRPTSSVITVETPRWNRDAAPRPVRLLVRPRTASPLLVLSNPSDDRPARFGRIRLLRSEGEAARAEPTQRFVALDWSDADLTHALGASHVRSDLGAFEQSDLATAWETAVALADRVEAAGGSGATIAVNQAGAAVYASQVWGSPRFDLAVWSDGTADLPRRELLTLVAREFERRGLRFAPVVRLDAPSSVIERLGGDDDPAGDGAAVTRRLLVDELLDAVGESPALAGIGLRISAEGWDLFGPTRTADEAGAARLATGYAELHELLQQRERPLALVVLPAEAARRNDFERALVPHLAGGGAAGAPLAASGLEALLASGGAPWVAAPHGAAPFGQAAAATSEVVLGALRRSGATPWSAQAVSLVAGRRALRLAESGRLLRDKAATTEGDLVLSAIAYDPDREGDVLVSCAAAGTEWVLLDGAAPAGWDDADAVRRRQRLAALPAVREGLKEEGSSDAELDVIAETTPLKDQETLATATNHTPWPQKARVTLRAAQRVRGQSLAAEAEAPRWFEAGAHALDVTLAPYETVAWRFAGQEVVAEGVQVEANPAAQRELAEALADLQSRDTTKRRPFERLANSSFESPGSDGGAPLAAWTATGSATLDPAVAVDGAASARLAADGAGVASLASDPFTAPTTGQLVVALRLRPGELSSDATLEIDLEEEAGLYRNRATLTADQLGGASAAEGGWLPPVVFPVEDLPLASGAPLRLRLTLTGQGVLWVDDVRLEDLLLPLDGRGAIDLRSERFAVVRLLQTSQKLLDEGRLGACRGALDSYWARFLMTHFPRRDAAVEVVQQAAPAEPAEPAETVEVSDQATDPTPSLGERVRGYLPRWWR